MSCNDMKTTQGYLASDDPQTVTFGCMLSGFGEPTEVPTPDQIPFYFDERDEVLYYYTCEPEQWTKVDQTIADLKPADITNIGNPGQTIKIPVVYKVGDVTVEGVVTLEELMEIINEADDANTVASVEKDEDGNIVVTKQDGTEEVLDLSDNVNDITVDDDGNIVVTKQDGSTETVDLPNSVTDIVVKDNNIEYTMVDGTKGSTPLPKSVKSVKLENGNLVVTDSDGDVSNLSLDSLGGITDVKREGDTLVITEGGRTFRVSIASGSADRPINFAPSTNGENVEITLADGSVLDMTRQEFADWLAGDESTLATDDELQDLADQIAGATDTSDLQDQIDALNDKLDNLPHDQAVLSIVGGNLVLTNDDGTKSQIALTSLVRTSSAPGNTAEVREDGLYVPASTGGSGGNPNAFDSISSTQPNLLTEESDGLRVAPTVIQAGSNITITGSGTANDPYIINGTEGGGGNYGPIAIVDVISGLDSVTGTYATKMKGGNFDQDTYLLLPEHVKGSDDNIYNSQSIYGKDTVDIYRGTETSPPSGDNLINVLVDRARNAGQEVNNRVGVKINFSTGGIDGVPEWGGNLVVTKSPTWV